MALAARVRSQALSLVQGVATAATAALAEVPTPLMTVAVVRTGVKVLCLKTSNTTTGVLPCIPPAAVLLLVVVQGLMVVPRTKCWGARRRKKGGAGGRSGGGEDVASLSEAGRRRRQAACEAGRAGRAEMRELFLKLRFVPAEGGQLLDVVKRLLETGMS